MILINSTTSSADIVVLKYEQFGFRTGYSTAHQNSSADETGRNRDGRRVSEKADTGRFMDKTKAYESVWNDGPL